MNEKKSGSKVSVQKGKSAALPRRDGYQEKAGGPPVITASIVLAGVMATLITIWFTLHASATTSAAPPASGAAKH